MYYLWREMINQNLSSSEIQFIMNDIYPYHKMNQKVFFFDPDKYVKADNNTFFGTNQVQELIRKKQSQKQPWEEVKRIFWGAEEDISTLVGLR